jgi:hypothetical protein
VTYSGHHDDLFESELGKLSSGKWPYPEIKDMSRSSEETLSHVSEVLRTHMVLLDEQCVLDLTAVENTMKLLRQWKGAFPTLSQ